jgi:DNA repair photolyase
MSRMFLVDGMPMSTWNVYVGCRFGCHYCNARKLAETRLKNSPRYRDGFRPHLVEGELRRRNFKPGQWVFVAYMGDIYFAELQEVKRILEVVRLFPETNFLFCTKQPQCYLEWLAFLPANCVLGVTLETNRFYASNAEPPWHRARWMTNIEWTRKMISIEPVMEFDYELVHWVKNIKPEIVEIGADNYHNGLPEPSRAQVETLISEISGSCGALVRKPGLERLKNE